MNLRAFHVVFIAASSLLAVALGVWCVRNYLDRDGTLTLVAAIASFAAALALLVYGSWFVRKVGRP